MNKVETIGDRVKALRLAKGLKQRELAALIGNLSFQNIGNLEQNKIKTAPRYINELAKVLGVTVDYLQRGQTHHYQVNDEIHDLLATDRPVDLDFNQSIWVVSVPEGVELTLPAKATVNGRIIKKFSSKL
jgi:transcriptional regulator with XRE-family HTH domain|tara:strand:+ start:683 stop:1072 length:390 start_codon:yes stop_codon:yes gene_type:complete